MNTSKFVVGQEVVIFTNNGTPIFGFTVKTVTPTGRITICSPTGEQKFNADLREVSPTGSSFLTLSADVDAARKQQRIGKQIRAASAQLYSIDKQSRFRIDKSTLQTELVALQVKVAELATLIANIEE